MVDLYGQSDGVTDDASNNPSGSSTVSVSGTPHLHHNCNSVKDDTEDIAIKDRAKIKEKKKKQG